MLVPCGPEQVVFFNFRRNQARHTSQVGQSSLSADKGGAADGCAHGGGRGASGRAHGAGAEESGGHCVVWCGGFLVYQGVVGLQWREQRRARSASKCTEEAPKLDPDVIRIT